MKSLTKALVLHPSDQEAAWLGRATALHIARRDWIGTFLIALTAFVAMRVMHAGLIRSFMVAIVVLAAAASTYAPRVPQALCAYAVARLRGMFFLNAAMGEHRLRKAAMAYTVACAGLWAVVVGYNVLALSVVAALLERPLEALFPAWPTVALVLLGVGWPALLLGEEFLLRALDR